MLLCHAYFVLPVETDICSSSIIVGAKPGNFLEGTVKAVLAIEPNFVHNGLHAQCGVRYQKMCGLFYPVLVQKRVEIFREISVDHLGHLVSIVIDMF